MTLIYVLLVAHFVADFMAQSDWMALNKSKRWDALALHVAAYSWLLFACVALAGEQSRPWLWTCLFYAAVNGAAHFVQDAITSRVTSRLWFLNITPTDVTGNIWFGGGNGGARVVPLSHVGYTGTRHWFFVAIGFDQLLHYVTLFVTADWWLR